MNYKPYKHLPPFKGMVLQNFPFIEEDFDAITNYQLLCKIVEYLRNVIANELTMEENVTNLYNSFVELKNYVDNYFENLDVQEEINNKLDAMVEDGTLQEIIAEYLNANALWCFDNIEDLKSASNLIEGSFARTLGYYSVNDGGGASYKIVSGDYTDNGGSYHELNNGLFAELINNDYINIKVFGATENSDDNTNEIQKCINYAKATNKRVYVPTGTFKISRIVFDYQFATLFGDSRKSVLRSINNNSTEDAVVVFSERGILNASISNIYIHGNKENNSNIFDGLLFTSEEEYGDSYALIDNVEAVSCTGNGIKLNGSKIREIRISNCRSAWNMKNGFMFYGATDSMFYNNTASVNQECGYYIRGYNHKISSCKAHTNGFGDWVTIDYDRTPASAYEETSDETPQTGKIYFTRTGTGYSESPYVFTEFTGSVFEDDVTYYECIKIYYKRYPGFYLEIGRSNIVNCEAQDNFGDGIYLNGGSNNIDAFIGDNNGRLTEYGNSTRNAISYETAGLEQIYDGVHIKPYTNNNVSGVFLNFRYATTGISQRAGLYIYSRVGHCNASIETDHQLYNVIVEYQGDTNENNIKVNGKYFYDEYDLTRIETPENYSIYSGASNISFLKKQGNKKELKLIISKTTNFVTTDEIVLCTLPGRFRPANLVTLFGYMSSAKGYNIRGTANITIEVDGKIHFRGSSSQNTDLIIECEYE